MRLDRHKRLGGGFRRSPLSGGGSRIPSGTDRQVYLALGLAISAVLLLAANLCVYPDAWQSSELDVAVCWQQVQKALEGSGVRAGWMVRRGDHLEAEVPPNMSLQVINFSLQRELRQVGAEIILAKEELLPAKLELVFGKGGRAFGSVSVLASQQERSSPIRLALIVDDFGYGMSREMKKLLGLPFDFTIAVIPGLKRTSAAVQAALAANKEVMIHMPMEPMQGDVEDNGFAIYTALPEDEIMARVNKAFHAVPAAKGLNNHEGSKATVDEKTMTTVMRALKQRGAFFVDSRTNSQSIAYTVARRMAVPALRSAGFLDVQDDEKWIRERFWELLGKAPAGSDLVVICHPRKKTIKVLAELMPEVAERGVEFVPASAVVY